MTDREALDKAQKELDTASYFEETSPYEGLKAVHRNKIAWLVRVLRLARKALYIEENQKQPITIADRIRAMSDEEIAQWLCLNYGCTKCPGENLCTINDGKHNGLKKWLKQPAEDTP